MVKETENQAIPRAWLAYAAALGFILLSSWAWSSLPAFGIEAPIFFAVGIALVVETGMLFWRVRKHRWRGCLPIAVLLASAYIGGEIKGRATAHHFAKLAPKFESVLNHVLQSRYPEEPNPEHKHLFRWVRPIQHSGRIVGASFLVESYGFAGGRGIAKIPDPEISQAMRTSKVPPNGWTFWGSDLGDGWYSVGAN
jgi:hypothetical protein